MQAGLRVDRDLIERDILERDRLDAGRTDGPLVRPPGAIEIDTSDHTAEQVVDSLETIAREKLPDAEFKQ